MNKALERLLRGAAAVAVLLVILMLVLDWWGDYRTGSPAVTPAESSEESTATPEGEAPAEGEEPAVDESVEQPAEEPAQGKVVVLVNGLNFRAGPSGSAELLDGFADGIELDYLGTESGWYKVRDSEGRVGYVSAGEQYTRLDQ